MSDAGLDKAKDEAKAARVRLLATAQQVRNRLEPSGLLDEALAGTRTQSVRIAQIAGDAARQRPAIFATAAAAVALLIIRRPLLRLGRRLFGRDYDGRHETEHDAAG